MKTFEYKKGFPEIKPLPIEPVVIPHSPEIAPHPDKNKPEHSSPEIIPSQNPEIKPIKEN
jgi:hypothetical protein